MKLRFVEREIIDYSRRDISVPVKTVRILQYGVVHEHNGEWATRWHDVPLCDEKTDEEIER